VQVEQRPQALPVRLALPLAQREPPRTRFHRDAGLGWCDRPAGLIARPSQPRPWLLFPLWHRFHLRFGFGGSLKVLATFSATSSGIELECVFSFP